jgi:hypothetical protein
MADAITYPIEGGCACGKIRYQLLCAPLVVNCCHCTYCQRETGSSFALNAVIEATNLIHITPQQPFLTKISSASGNGQTLARCLECYVVVWSNYSFNGPFTRCVRVGTLDQPDVLGGPEAHVYVESKQKWVNLEGEMCFEGYYDEEKVWRRESLERFERLKPQIAQWRKETG